MSTSATYKPTEGKREEFRRYLEKSGVMDALTKVLVCLYEEPEKPTDALQYLITKLTLQTGGETVESIKAQLMDAQARIDNLQKENDLLRGAEGQPPQELPPEGGEDIGAPPPIEDTPPPEEPPPEQPQEGPLPEEPAPTPAE